MCLELKSDYQKSSRLKSLFRVVYIQGHETNLGFGVLQDTPEKFLGPSRGSWHISPENFKNGVSDWLKIPFMIRVTAMK